MEEELKKSLQDLLSLIENIKEDVDPLLFPMLDKLSEEARTVVRQATLGQWEKLRQSLPRFTSSYVNTAKAIYGGRLKYLSPSIRLITNARRIRKMVEEHIASTRFSPEDEDLIDYTALRLEHYSFSHPLPEDIPTSVTEAVRKAREAIDSCDEKLMSEAELALTRVTRNLENQSSITRIEDGKRITTITNPRLNETAKDLAKITDLLKEKYFSKCTLRKKRLKQTSLF